MEKSALKSQCASTRADFEKPWGCTDLNLSVCVSVCLLEAKAAAEGNARLRLSLSTLEQPQDSFNLLSSHVWTTQTPQWRLMPSGGMEQLRFFPSSCAVMPQLERVTLFFLDNTPRLSGCNLSTLQQEWLVSPPQRTPLSYQSFLFQCFPPQWNKTFLLALFRRAWSNSELSVQPRPVATTALFSVLKGKQCFTSWCQTYILLSIREGIFLAQSPSAGIQCWAQPCWSCRLFVPFSKSLNSPFAHCFSPLPSFPSSPVHTEDKPLMNGLSFSIRSSDPKRLSCCDLMS